MSTGLLSVAVVCDAHAMMVLPTVAGAPNEMDATAFCGLSDDARRARAHLPPAAGVTTLAIT